MTRQIFLAFVLTTLSGIAQADTNHQPYKGHVAREITSLSEDDVRQLREGAGWGLALPAELNGYPGPAHVLELRNQLGLSEEQARVVTAMYDAMRRDAVAKGEALIEAERALDHAFRSGGLDADGLKTLIDTAEAARADLRFVHLSRHLAMLDLLTAEQIDAYTVLRGYRADPCASVPEGHDATMWRRHNNCGDE